MDLGIKGKKAIVCASSRGLGRGCAMALAEAVRDLTRQAILDGVTQNRITPIELIKAVIEGMAERGFGRIVNITSLSVYVPIPGLDVSSGARAGLTAFLAGIARTVVSRN